MQTNRKISVLKAIGVQVWRDRKSEIKEALCFHALSLEASKSIIILADYDFEHEAEERSLLEAISKALGFIVVATTRNWSECEAEMARYSTVIVMGDKISTHIKSRGEKFIFTHAPSTLLKEPKLKAQTWQAIKHLKV